MDMDNTPEAEKAKAIYNGLRVEGMSTVEATHALVSYLAMITSPRKEMRESGKRRVRELAAKGKTGI